MHWTARVVIGACATTMLASVPPTAQAAPAEVGGREQTPTFIEALSAIPDASAAITKAVKAVGPVRERARAQQETARRAQLRLTEAFERVHEVGLVRTRADLASLRAQLVLDDAARALYSTGGSVPTLAEVLLTSDSPSGLTTSLLTREHLALSANSLITARTEAEEAAAAATRAAEGLQEDRDVVAGEAAAASTAATLSARDLVDAQDAVVQARQRYRQLMRITSVDRSAEYGKVKKCGDWLTKLLSRTGFEGEDLREAWAIVMRESGGREDAISVTNDLGLFQINTATWKKEPWFDRKELLTRKYNARIGHLISRGGKSWYSWGLDGHGRPDARAYVKVGWTPEHIRRSIINGYVAWYQQYPCRPSYESGYPYPLPPPNADEKPDSDAEFAGGGLLPGVKPEEGAS